MQAAIPGETDLVVLIHGLAAKRAVMWPLAVRLMENDLRDVSWRYSSLFKCLDYHAERLYSFLSHELAGERRIHLVAHSMGSIVVRGCLAERELRSLGNIVFLAPPNRGSPLARAASPYLGKLLRPLPELSDSEDSYVNRLPLMKAVKLGIIAARYDVLVPVRNTYFAGAAEHVTLNATHNSLLLSKDVMNRTASFLKTGSFGLPR